MVGHTAGGGWASVRVWAQVPAPTEALSLVQIITAVSIAVTVIMLGFSLWKGLRRARLRPLFDVARIVVQAATAVAVPLITGVSTTPVLVIAALAVGLVLGLAQGQRLVLEVDDEQLFATRSMAGFIVWGGGLVLMQGAGLANRTGLVEIGQAVTWLSIGITAGLIVGRHAKVSSTLQSAAMRSAPVVLLIVALLGACVDAAEIDTIVESDGSGSFEIALGVEPDPEEPLSCDADDGVPGAYTYADNRGQGLQWCVIGFGFSSLGELADLYVNLDEGEGFATVECLAFVGDQVAYKILLELESNEEGDIVPWRVTVPGPITSSNADEVDGSTATWFLGSTLGQVPLDINVEDTGRCPSEGFELRLSPNPDGSGTASLRAPQLATGEDDTATLVADLTAAGWNVGTVAPGSGSFSATQTWESGRALHELIASLPPLEGSTIDLIPGQESGETDFDAFVDLSFYETYWRDINPTLADPPFRLVYAPTQGVLLTNGDWTNESALTFDWTTDDDGRVFNLFATTGGGGAAPDQGDTDRENTNGGDADDGGTEDDAGDSSEGGSDADETAGQPDQDSAGAPGSPELTEAQAAQTLLDLLDSQEVSENEALATAIAGLAAAAAAGLLSLAEAARAAQELADAAAQNRAERTSARAAEQPAPAAPANEVPPRPPGPLRQMTPTQLRHAMPHVSRDELERLADAIQDDIDTNVGHKLPPLLDETLDLDGIRQRIADGTLTQADFQTLVRGQDFTGTTEAQQLAREGELAQNVATATRIGEGFVEGTMMTAKAAASTAAGPAGGAMITAAVDAVAARHLGMSEAIKTGLTHAALDFGQGKFAQAIAGLPLGQRVTGGALSGGLSAMVQNLHDQLAANGGDVDSLDWEQAQNAGMLGMGFGGLGGIDGKQPDVPTLQGRPRGFSSELGDGFSLSQSTADLPTLPGKPRGFGSELGDGFSVSSSAPDVPAGTPGAPSADLSTAPRGPSADLPAATPRADGPDVPTTQADRPSVTHGEAGATQQPTQPTASSNDPGATKQPTQPTASSNDPGATKQPTQPNTSSSGQVTAPDEQPHMSVRPEPNPNADLPAGQATTADTQAILDNLETSPRAGIDAGGPGRPSRPSDLDHEGNVWVGGRQVGTMNEHGQLVNASGQPIRIAHDLHSGASVGYVEVDTSGLPGRPLHNAQGQPVGRVSESGHILNPDGSIQMHNGAPARAAIDADGDLVPYSGPDLADVRPEYDQTYSGRRVEHPNPNQTPAPDLHEMGPETRVPVLDANGNPTHMVEAVPREIHFDANGQPEFVQHQFPARAQSMGDLPLSRDPNPRFDPEQGHLSMPTPDNWGSTAARTPLVGPDAPPRALVVRSDPSGATPTGYAATSWDAVGANADGVAVSPSGTPVVRVDAQGNFFDLQGQPVTSVAARDGRVIGFTDAGGQRWIVDDGPTQ